MLQRVGVAAITLLLAPQVGNAGPECNFLDDDYFTRAYSGTELIACLERGYRLDIQDKETGNTPLHLAARDAMDPFLFEDIAILVPAGMREDLIHVQNAQGLNPFHLAVREERGLHTLANLARWGDVVDSAFNSEGRAFWTRGTTALHLAAEDWEGEPEEIDMLLALLALGAKADALDAQGMTPLDRIEDDFYTASLILGEDVWREAVADRVEDLASLEGRPIPGCDIRNADAFARSSDVEAWLCMDSLFSGRSDPAALWSMLDGGDNFLHRLVRSSPDTEVLDAVLGAAEKHGTLDAALSTENLDGYTPLHLAAAHAEDPLTVVQLARWGARVDSLAHPRDDGFLSATTGETPLHLAARREDKQVATRMVTALLAQGAAADVYDNNVEANPLDEDLGLQALDYLSENENVAAMALVGPGFSFCKEVDANKKALVSALGIGGAVATTSGGATIASTAAGITAVTHSSGAVILTGSSGYIAGTLGTLGSGAIAVLTAPATVTAAAATVVAVGSTVLYCTHAS